MSHTTLPINKTMSTIAIYLLLLSFTNFICIALAFDSTPWQDFCVADLKSTQTINGLFPCKDPQSVTSDDFYHTGLDKPGNTSNPFKAGLTVFGVKAVPGLNTLGFAVARLDLEPGGLYPPHRHPRGSELHIVIEGQLEVGFVSPDQGYKYYNKTLNAGDMFVVPPGLLHVQRNVGTGHTSSYAIFNSQNPGNDIVTQGVFGASPAIDANFLAAGFQLDVETIKTLQKKQWAS